MCTTDRGRYTQQLWVLIFIYFIQHKLLMNTHVLNLIINYKYKIRERKSTKKSMLNLKKLSHPFNYFLIYSLVESHHWVFSIVGASLELPSIDTMGECHLPSSVFQISWKISLTFGVLLFNFFHCTYSTDLRSFSYGGL